MAFSLSPSLSRENDRTAGTPISSHSALPPHHPILPLCLPLLPCALILSLVSADHLPGWFVLCPPQSLPPLPPRPMRMTRCPPLKNGSLNCLTCFRALLFLIFWEHIYTYSHLEAAQYNQSLSCCPLSRFTGAVWV